jgi:hypothetical protein
MATSRHSTVRDDRIEYGFWLIFDAEGNVTMTRGEPPLRSGQRAMQCTAELPMSLFRTPALSAKIKMGQANDLSRMDIEALATGLGQELTALRTRFKLRTGDDA